MIVRKTHMPREVPEETILTRRRNKTQDSEVAKESNVHNNDPFLFETKSKCSRDFSNHE